MAHDQRTDRYGDQEYRGDRRGDQGGVFGSNRRGEQRQSWVDRILPGSAGEDTQPRRGGDRPGPEQPHREGDVAWSTQTPEGSGLDQHDERESRRHAGGQAHRRGAGDPGTGGPGSPGGPGSSPTRQGHQRTRASDVPRGRADRGETGVGGERSQPTGHHGGTGHSEFEHRAGTEHGQEHGGRPDDRHRQDPRRRRIQERRETGRQHGATEHSHGRGRGRQRQYEEVGQYTDRPAGAGHRGRQHRYEESGSTGQNEGSSRTRQHAFEESGQYAGSGPGGPERSRQQQYEGSSRGHQAGGGTYNRHRHGGRDPRRDRERDDERLGFSGARGTAGVFR